MSIYEFLQGFIIGSSLIIAIGPQNLFVINQGLKKNANSSSPFEFELYLANPVCY